MVRGPVGRFDRLSELAAELVRLKVDVIVAGPTPAAAAAKDATATIPIVMAVVGDPGGLGLIASLARPGGNVTGLSYSVGVETFGKGLELLKETIPKVRRIAAAMAKERAGALLVAADSLFNLHRTRLADLAMRRRLPTMFGIKENVEAGGLMSYGPSLPDLWRRTATFVDKILKGAKPADVPVEQPTRFELTINLKTAKALGLTIPQSVLSRADQLIE